MHNQHLICMWVASLCWYSLPHCREVAIIGSMRGILTMWMVFVLTSIMWQSHVKIEYFVAYLDHCIAAFKAPYRWTSVKGGGSYVLCGLIRYSHSYICPCNALLGVRVRVWVWIGEQRKIKALLSLWWQTWTLLIYSARMSPTLNRSSAIWCFECGHVIEIRDRMG